MTLTTLGRRYGKALLDLATEQKIEAKVGKELAELGATWSSSASLRQIFEDPSVLPEQRRKILDEVCKRSGVSPIVRNTLALLSDRQRMPYLLEVIEAYAHLAEEREGRVHAEVVSATALPDAYVAQLQKALEQTSGCKVTIVKKVDPTLIAGVVTRIGDVVVDGSLKSQLGELAEALLTTP